MSIKILSLLLLASSPASANNYTLVKVIDGDTIKVSEINSENKPFNVRLACIDAPERGQAGYEFSKTGLESLLQNNPILNISEDSPIDGYGRPIAEIYFGESFLNELILQNGLAHYYEKYSENCSKTKEILQQAETKAKQQQLGIWSPPSFPPLSPEFFRKIRPFM